MTIQLKGRLLISTIIGIIVCIPVYFELSETIYVSAIGGLFAAPIIFFDWMVYGGIYSESYFITLFATFLLYFSYSILIANIWRLSQINKSYVSGNSTEETTRILCIFGLACFVTFHLFCFCMILESVG